MFFFNKLKFFANILIIFILCKFNNINSAELTEAHKLLVSTDHLSNINAPSKIKYIFKKKGTLEPNFNDRVVMIIPEKDKEGYYDIKFDFFTGYNKEDLKSAKYKKNNPIIHAFWEHDINLMARLTEGSWIYFRKRITWSMSDEHKFKIEEGKCVLNESEYNGHTVVMKPYEDDYDSKKFSKFAKKKYYVTLCKEIPGMIYEMGTIVPPEKEGDKPLMKETLTFDKILK